MNISDYLLNKFNCIEEKFYDEAEIELKIIELEVKLKYSKDIKDIFDLYIKIKNEYILLNKLRSKRLINFIINESQQKPAK